MKTANNKLFVELHVPNVKQAEKFYQKIGFTIVRERKMPGKKDFAVVECQGNIITLWPKSSSHAYFGKFPKTTKQGFNMELVFLVDKVEKIYKKIKNKANVVEPLKIRPSGLKDFRIEDPFGFYLRFTEPYNVLKGPKK